ncbi:MAG: polyprenyl diphosphate synthase [Defluviitaleaceae bacterium]|nr:polyprenyl diphosphate synthase [Defluviitaleaceae bacterium]
MAEKIESSLPAHVAIIMDGNGRWGKSRLLPRSAGHRAGAQNLRRLAEDADKLGLKYLTVYAFSTENWTRPDDEVSTLWNLFREYIGQYMRDSKKNGIRISFIGDRTRIDRDLREQMERLEDMTRAKPGLNLILAMNYGGRDEIVRSARKLCEDAQKGRLAPEEVTEEMFAKSLDTAKIPDPDLIVRTAGEMRLSNFLLWQSAYAEYIASPKYFPDFKIADLKEAIEQYNGRDRRYGGAKPAGAPAGR